MKPASTAGDTAAAGGGGPSSRKSTPVLFSSEECGASLVAVGAVGVEDDVGVSGM